MAARRSLYAGGSYGRVQAGIIWALDHWQEFDSWCCIKNIDPLELPSYRFYNLIMYCLKEGRSEEQLEWLEKELATTDNDKHPLHQMTYKPILKKRVKNEPPPVESRHTYIPSWWRGDHQNYNVAKQVMKNLP